jgi:hypothetical protein
MIVSVLSGVVFDGRIVLVKNITSARSRKHQESLDRADTATATIESDQADQADRYLRNAKVRYAMNW